MNSAEWKLKIFRHLDVLDEETLEKVYQLLLPLFRESSASWNKLSTEQQEGIKKAIEQLDAGEGATHKKVMSRFRKKYNA